MAALLIFSAFPAAADIFIVRHAEKKDPKQAQSRLSAQGLKRARDLRHALSFVNLKAVYCTEFVRTRQTAAPTAADHKLVPIEIVSDDASGLAKRLLAHPREDALVVGHSDTIPDLIRTLGVKARVTIADDDYDNLLIVSPRKAGGPVFHWLHYGR